MHGGSIVDRMTVDVELYIVAELMIHLFGALATIGNAHIFVSLYAGERKIVMVVYECVCVREFEFFRNIVLFTLNRISPCMHV